MAKVSSAAALKIGKRIRTVRQKLGISLEDLGELSEISWTSVGKIERGASSPTAESLVRIATALEVDPGIFLSGIVADDYGKRAHRFTVRDLIRGRDKRQTTAAAAQEAADDEAAAAAAASQAATEAEDAARRATETNTSTPGSSDDSAENDGRDAESS